MKGENWLFIKNLFIPTFFEQMFSKFIILTFLEIKKKIGIKVLIFNYFLKILITITTSLLVSNHTTTI